MIWAYGKRGDLDFSIIRPFNWIGPKLESLETAKEGSSRVVTQFIASLVSDEPIMLVDGGSQSRSFTYIADGIEALMKIIVNKDGKATGRIFNIGNPKNNCSIKDLADMLISLFKRHPAYSEADTNPGGCHEGAGFLRRELSGYLNEGAFIENAVNLLGWQPKVGLEDALRLTLESF